MNEVALLFWLVTIPAGQIGYANAKTIDGPMPEDQCVRRATEIMKVTDFQAHPLTYAGCIEYHPQEKEIS